MIQNNLHRTSYLSMIQNVFESVCMCVCVRTRARTYVYINEKLLTSWFTITNFLVLCNLYPFYVLVCIFCMWNVSFKYVLPFKQIHSYSLSIFTQLSWFYIFLFLHESNLTCVYKILVSLCRPVIYFNSSSLSGNVHCKVPWGCADSDKHYRNLDLLFVVIITDLVLSPLLPSLS